MNNLYVGTSIIEIERVKKSLKNPKFLSRLFSPQELKYLMSRSFSPNIIAECFCAKLAFGKAMGYNFRGCSLNEISVLKDFMDTPYISVSGRSKIAFAAKGCNMTLSVSHCKEYASATVVFFNKN